MIATAWESYRESGIEGQASAPRFLVLSRSDSLSHSHPIPRLHTTDLSPHRRQAGRVQIRVGPSDSTRPMDAAQSRPGAHRIDQDSCRQRAILEPRHSHPVMQWTRTPPRPLIALKRRRAPPRRGGAQHTTAMPVYAQHPRQQVDGPRCPLPFQCATRVRPRSRTGAAEASRCEHVERRTRIRARPAARNPTVPRWGRSRRGVARHRGSSRRSASAGPAAPRDRCRAVSAPPPPAAGGPSPRWAARRLGVAAHAAWGTMRCGCLDAWRGHAFQAGELAALLKARAPAR